jgi:hypothetical protein
MLKTRIVHRGFNIFNLLSCVAFAATALAQEPPAPTSSAAPAESPSPSIQPEESVVPSPTPEQTSSPSPARSVRVSFVPPPMDGTISLGIYDQAGKIVRVLHQNAQFDDFTIGADALATRWDGKDNEHVDLPAGRYRARGYLVGPLKLADLGTTLPPSLDSQTHSVVKIRLIRNPLRKDKKPAVELGVGFGAGGTYLETIDGLPLLKISDTPNIAHTLIATKSENAVDVWQDDGTEPHQFRISNVDQMMAFDCGELELK